MRLFLEKQCLTFLKSTFLNAGSRCKFRIVYKVDGNPQLDSRDLSMYSNILNFKACQINLLQLDLYNYIWNIWFYIWFCISPTGRGFSVDVLYDLVSSSAYASINK